MKTTRLTTLCLASFLASTGCIQDAPCPLASQTAVAAAAADPVYKSMGNPYEPGPLVVRSLTVRRCSLGVPVDLNIFAPQAPGTYATVVFQHGFMARSAWYSDILRHLASHGFVVVAPQMYEPGLAPLLGNPTAAREAERAAVVLDWLPAHLSTVTGVAADTTQLGLAGHSRGGKVAWLLLTQNPLAARSFAGLDPVDGTGGPRGNQARAIQGPADFVAPTLIVGTGLGGACAPAGENHVQFYAAAPAPAWHVIAVNQGHADVLDEAASGASLTTHLCQSGPDRAGMRTLTAGLLAAFFRATLQDDTAALPYLSDPAAAPIPVAMEQK